jgi:hypothetical protein
MAGGFLLVLFVGLRAGAGGWEIVIKGGPADPEALGNGRYRDSRIDQHRARHGLVGFAKLALPPALAATG